MYILIRCKTRNRRHARTASIRGDGHTPPRSEQLYTHGQPRPERHQGAQQRHAITNDPDNLHAMSNHTQNDIRAYNLNRFREADGRTLVPGWKASRHKPCARGASRTPSSARVCVRIYLQVSPYLHHTKGQQCGGCPFSFEVCSKSQFALTVKKLTRFQGFDLRIAVFGKFGF